MKKNRFREILGGGVNCHEFLFEKIISSKNIFAAWREFQKGKMSKLDVIAFSEKVEENLFDLISDLENGTYAHGQYSRFCVYDPKRREIAKASVRDRVLHHAIHRVLAPKFDSSFIFDSFSSRMEKGTHAAVLRLRKFAQKISKNHTKTVWALQLDIRKFFDSVDHDVLLSLLRKKILDDKVMGLLEIIVNSFEVLPGKGIPLGNLTSQLFSNVYLDPFDQFVKRKLGVKFYLRYADDSVMLSDNKIFLENCLLEINSFVIEKLKLELHARKIIFKKWHQGIDFLGYVIFPHHTILRTRTKKRAFRKIHMNRLELVNNKITKKYFNGVVQSYLGILKHCRGFEIKKKIQKIIKVYDNTKLT